MKRTLAVCLLAGAVGGCALLPGGGPQLGSSQGGWGRKTVEAKEEPATLVAMDGTLCTVTATKFRNAKTGDRIFCYWRPRGGSP